MSKPWIQVSIDTQDLATAKTHIEHALAIDAEWVEAGTPLLTFAGIESIGEVVKLVGDRTVVADFKAMDGVGPYFARAAALGAGVATVMAVATEASIATAIDVAHKHGAKVQVDLLGIPRERMASVVSRIADMGADYFLIHLAIDELLQNPDADPLEGLDEAVGASSVPVGLIVFTNEQGIEAVKRGAQYVVVGYPFILAEDARAQLTDFAETVRGAVRSGS
jgi:3-hexulose-6-phosphate synthase